jgi:hypothetical protein
MKIIADRSCMGLEILLSVFPLALTYSAWRFQQKSHPPLSKIRRILFRCGLLMSVLCSLTVLSSWFDPFPLLPDGHGGYSDIRNGILFTAGFSTAFRDGRFGRFRTRSIKTPANGERRTARLCGVRGAPIEWRLTCFTATSPGTPGMLLSKSAFSVTAPPAPR